ncbi:SHOCT domain-containing protein [Mycoplasma marinum]|uniref:SHOCT domain-containing protein n=1 Tax=Mycoplasma marinum TaxID=1937190 RepID=A0A4R0XWD1_9MOLU|nr:SHOCT domain-containing protein [Mycoplasma marinum]TCG11281.1 hypothetical protein C4B24_02440 [Mycoplasma marinum]
MNKNQIKKYKNYKSKTIAYTLVSILITVFLVLYSRFDGFGIGYWQASLSIISILIIIFSILGLISFSRLTKAFGGHVSLTMCHLFLWGSMLLPSFFTLLVIDKGFSPLSWIYFNHLNPLLIITIILILIGFVGLIIAGATVRMSNKNTLSISSLDPKREMHSPYYKSLKKLHGSSYTFVTWIIVLLLLAVIWYETPIKEIAYNEENYSRFFSLIEIGLCGLVILIKWIITMAHSSSLANRDGFLETNRADLKKLKLSSKINLLGIPLALATKTAIKNYEENTENISNEIKASKKTPIKEITNEYSNTSYKTTSYKSTSYNGNEGSINSLKLKIDKLHELKEAGVISQSEYENQRKDLINKIFNSY